MVDIAQLIDPANIRFVIEISIATGVPIYLIVNFIHNSINNKLSKNDFDFHKKEIEEWKRDHLHQHAALEDKISSKIDALGKEIIKMCNENHSIKNHLATIVVKVDTALTTMLNLRKK
jgi:hypothetical protein